MQDLLRIPKGDRKNLGDQWPRFAEGGKGALLRIRLLKSLQESGAPMTIENLSIPKGVDELQIALNMGFYYDYHTLIGKEVAMPEFVSKLAQLPRKDALRALSSMAAWVSRPGNMRIRPQVEAAKAILPRDLAEAYATKLHEEMTKAGPGIVFHLQQIRFVLQWAIICCKDDSPPVPIEELQKSIGACCLNDSSRQQLEERRPPTWSRRVNGIEVAFWKTRPGDSEDTQEQCTLKIKKTYYDREKSTKTQAVYTEAKSFFPGEVPILAALLQDAFSAMGQRE